MILSHAHRFIFLKTTKTAGTSAEIALSRICGQDDIITPISPDDEMARAKAGGLSARNYLYPREARNPEQVIGIARGARAVQLANGTRAPLKFFNHMSARDLIAKVGADIWRDYFTFCIERNPWDRAVSHYYYRHTREPRPRFGAYLRSSALLTLKRDGRELYTLDGKVVVDRILRFESLKEDLREVFAHLGVDGEPELPKTKTSFRPERSAYRELYSEGDRTLIAELFRDEIELMGYRF
jgi:hypothetical protein